ncbi:MAG: ABC transporter substrate-binding protein [Clostridia bacterium]|nr:ABC transporter substrate-binding protein [Clostridia bacterium]
MKQTISKVLATIVSLAMIAALASCAGKNDKVSGSDADAPKTQVTTTVNVGALIGPTGVSMAKLAAQEKTFAEAYSDDSSEYVNTYKTVFAEEPTQMVAMLSSGEADVVCVPTNLAAKLYKVTTGNVKVAAVSTLGVLYFIDTSGEVSSVADLEGKTIYAPSTVQGSNPEYILNYLIEKNGVNAKVNFDFTVDELTAKIVKGDVQTIMVPEPKATAIKGQLKKNEKTFTVTNVQEEWNKVCDTPIAQGVVVVRADWLKDNEGAFKTFLNDFAASTDAAVNDTEAVAADVVSLGIIPNEALAKTAMPGCNLVCKTGDEMKQSVSNFLDVLLAADPQSVGGAVPDDAFYYLG